MNQFMLTLSTRIEADEGLAPIRHACGILRRDMRECLTGTGADSVIRVLLMPGLGAERYEARVTGGVLTLHCGDSLGAVYGLLSLSERCLGIQPLDWWHGRRPRRRACAPVPPEGWTGPRYAVRWRCWFFNDERLLDGWKNTEADRREVWRRLFETCLRCGGNMVIPGTDRAEDGDDLRRLALDMGLWLTSDHTQLLSARMFSRVWPDLEPSYTKHPDLFEALWREAAEKWAGEKMVWTVGFRGQGDRGFWHDDPTFDTDEKRGAFISRMILRQMELVREYSPDAVFATNLYGEMMALYRQGLLRVPPEVMLIWGDNGYGRMVSRRQDLSNPRTDAMPGEDSGHPQGIYYHIAFYDLQAANFLTMLQEEPGLVAEELRTVCHRGATGLWNINVGSFKPHLFWAALVSRFWRDGDCDPEAFAREYAQAYYGSEAAAPLLLTYGQAALPYGPHADDRAGDQFYHFALRALARALVLPGPAEPVASLRWVAPTGDFREQARQIARLARPGLDSWEDYLRRCEAVRLTLPPEGRAALEDSLILQAKIHLSGCQALCALCQCVVCAPNAAAPAAFLWCHEAVRAARRGVQALREAEHGDFVGIYRNDCYANLAQSQRVLEALRGHLRLRGDGEMQYDWEKEYLFTPGERLVMLQTHRWAQLDDDALGEALRGRVPMTPVGDT